MNELTIEEQTLNWIRCFVINYNICPFAKYVVDKGLLRIHVSDAQNTELALEALMSAIYLLNDSLAIDTILVVFPFFLQDFYDYLDFADLAEELMVEQGYEGMYQLATFHPNYCFAGVEENDITHFTNRSPYPMLHILRESSLDKSIDHYGDTDKISENNMNTLRRMGLNEIKKLYSLSHFKPSDS